MGWFQKEGLLFLPGNLQWKLVNSLHTTNHLGENTLQRLLERSLRGTGLQMTIRQVLSSCPTCQLNNPPRTSKTPAGPACPMTWDLPRRGLADGLQPDASFSRVYIPISHDRYIHRMDGWKKQWQPTPVLLPGNSHGWRSLVGYSPWGRKESDTAERLHFHALEKEMATHSPVLAWRIPGMEEPGGLLSMG